MNELINKIYGKLVDFCSYRPRSERELAQKFNTVIRRHTTELANFDVNVTDLQAKLIQKLKDAKILDETSAVDQYVQSYLVSSKAKSVLMLRKTLQTKGFSSNLVSQALEAISTDFDDSKALDMAKKYIAHNQPLNKPKLKLYLLRKGFTYKSISKALADLT